MNQLASAFVRLGNALYPLLTSFALAAGCTAADAPAGDEAPDAPPPEEPTEPTPPEEPDAGPPTPVAGTLDTSFGDGGIAPLALDAGYAAAVIAQGDKLLTCTTQIAQGASGADWVATVARWDTTGALDTTFGDGGVVRVAEAGARIACRSLALSTDGWILAGVRALGAQPVDAVAAWTADGKEAKGQLPMQGALARIGAGAGPDQFVVAQAPNNLTQVISFRAEGPVVAQVLGGVTGTPVRAFLRGDTRGAVGVFTEDGVTGWQVLAEVGEGELATLGPQARAASTAGAVDLMSDAIALPDGSMFAVGGAGNGLSVMTARFVFGSIGVPSTMTMETHAHGGPSMAMGVTLDGAGRPIVVGKASDGGASVFGWARYAAASTTLDTAYGDAGLAQVAPPSGQGELIAAARVDGAIYALGQYDVETAEPKLALVKIHE